MESFKLDILALIPQSVHDDLQVLHAGDVSGHDCVVAPVEQYLAEQLEGLTFRYIIRREHKGLVCCEKLRITTISHGPAHFQVASYLVVIGLQVSGNHLLVPRQALLDIGRRQIEIHAPPRKS